MNTSNKKNDSFKFKFKKSMNNLDIVKFILNSFDLEEKQMFVDRCDAINTYYKGSGSGMTTGTIIEKLLIEHFGFSNYNVDQNDLKITDIPLSFKKVTGCSSFSLNWGNNKDKRQVNCTSNILLFNVKTVKYFNYTCKSGFYIIDKKHLLNIELSRNNRSDNVINSKNIFFLLQSTIKDDLFIELPEVSKSKISYNLITGFA